ncbi:KRAB-A domain-containing protein 2-like [Palaemon carinicauda]|uniref:KRAB-A domain-containing protein 2-like n=1 Tax=Palaemon carinicauda TaxID=392227 RepID=UPI0035B60B17
MSIEERFTQNLADHFKENKKGLIPKRDYQKTIGALKASADNSHAKRCAHISTGHGVRDQMLKELPKKYANIATKAIELFNLLCQECQKKQKTADGEGGCHSSNTHQGILVKGDNGSEFTSQVITELKEVWPKLILVHGKPCHPQSQGSVERTNGDIKDILVAWMADDDSQDWLTGIKFVQF